MWEVNKPDNIGPNIFISAKDTSSSLLRNEDLEIIVHPPTFIERLFGITFEQKVQRAIRLCQKLCDIQNKKEELAIKTIETLEDHK